MPDWGSIFGAIGEGARGYQSFQTLGPQWREIQAEQERKRQAEAQQEQDRQAAAAQNLTTSRNADARAQEASEQQRVLGRSTLRERAQKGYGSAYAGFLAEQDRAREAGPLPPEREPRAPSASNFIEDPNDPEMGAWLEEVGPPTGRGLYENSKAVTGQQAQQAQMERARLSSADADRRSADTRAASMERALLAQGGQNARQAERLDREAGRDSYKDSMDAYKLQMANWTATTGANTALTRTINSIRNGPQSDEVKAQMIAELKAGMVEAPAPPEAPWRSSGGSSSAQGVGFGGEFAPAGGSAPAGAPAQTGRVAVSNDAAGRAQAQALADGQFFTLDNQVYIRDRKAPGGMVPR